MTIGLSHRQGSVGRLQLFLLNWSWRHAPGGSEWIEPDIQSVLRNLSLVMPKHFVVTQHAWALVGRH